MLMSTQHLGHVNHAGMQGRQQDKPAAHDIIGEKPATDDIIGKELTDDIIGTEMQARQLKGTQQTVQGLPLSLMSAERKSSLNSKRYE
mmetsp:Transcript_9066/g.28313  ORF Transcript_9066/g.28313 Transcript_9066/m.28313 type:complete len:88 (+) Transcript_9066:422-685(+)